MREIAAGAGLKSAGILAKRHWVMLWCEGSGARARICLRRDALAGEPKGGGGVSEPGAMDKVLVQVVPVEGGREIGWGSSQVEAFRDRLSDVREAVISGAQAVADSLPGLPSADGWQLGEVSGSFGICLTAEGGVILTKASAAVTFEVTVTFQRR
jgi:hypothetical protein